MSKKDAQTIDAMAQNNNKLTAKDLVLVAVLGVLLFVVLTAVSMVFSFNAHLVWFTHTVGAIPAGIVYAYLVGRVPKRGALTLMGIIVGILGFLMGMFWTGPVGLIVGGILADLVIGSSENRSATRRHLSFAVFMFSFWLGQIMLILISGESYVQTCVASGLTEEYARTLIDFVFGPMGIVAGITTIVGAILGSMLGSKIFSKYFTETVA